jgi:amyloid beta precursor protein binding protein 1
MLTLFSTGIGYFAVIDNKQVSGRDIGNNFFVVSDCVGQPRARVVTEFLKELNEDVQSAIAREEDPVVLIENNPDFVKEFSVVIATELPPHAIEKLADVCWRREVPLFIARAYGLVASLRVQSPEHTIVELKPDFPPEDLRLSDPFPELQNFADKVPDLTQLNSREHSHCPFPVLLLKARSQWRATHNNRLPSTRAEKEEFKALIRSMQRNPDEENFEEAFKNAFHAYEPYTIPSEVQALLNDPLAINLTPTSSSFWIVVHALREFVQNEGNGKLPLKGSIPDMHTESHTYIALQTLYKERAEQDVQVVLKRVRNILTKLGRPPTSISEDEVRLMCKNALTLRVLRFRSLKDELTALNRDELAMQLTDPSSTAGWYVLFRAVDDFYKKYNRYPGDKLDDDLEKDFNALKDIVVNFLEQHKLPSLGAEKEGPLNEAMIREMYLLSCCH